LERNHKIFFGIAPECILPTKEGSLFGLWRWIPVWAAHKLWLSKRNDREPIKRRRDEAQARAVGSLVSEYLPHLPFEQEQLRMLPKKLFDEAAPLFVSKSSTPAP
jgi:Nucleotidyltransferase